MHVLKGLSHVCSLGCGLGTCVLDQPLFLGHTAPPPPHGHLVPQGLRAVYKGQGPGFILVSEVMAEQDPG